MDGAVVRRWCRLSAEALGQTRAAIDALNVYPVPDSDTGTNLYRTLLSAAQAVDELPATAAPGDVWRAAATGAMLGACGNSGIILSQLLRGLADVCGPAAPCDGPVVARALGHAAGLARAAVSRPVEGTVLTVADAAAQAAAVLCLAAGSAASGSAASGAVGPAGAGRPALSAGAAGVALTAVVLAASAAAREALGLTTGQLAALAERGVVDAGGAGLCVVLDAWAAAIGGTTGTFEVPAPGVGLDPVPGAAAAGSAGQAPSGYAPSGPAQSPGYEVTYLLEAPAAAVAGLREELDALGDSLVIAGGGETGGAEPGGLWSVHVHVPEAGPAIEAGLRLGRPRRITVSYLGLPPATGHGVLALCDTPGLAALAEAAGAEVLCYGSEGAPAAGEISMAVRRLGRRCIIVPNGSPARAAAAAAARDLEREGIEVVVVDVSSAVQALPALAVHEPAAEFAADAAAMARAASRMRHGMRPTGPAATARATTEVLAMTDELLAGGAELMTVLIGAQAPAGLAEQVTAHVRAVSPATEVECHVGAVPGAVVLAGAE
jgi:dihydroxyacetone kinase-like predicted kinase